MSTLVFLHAHPDDESSLTAGISAMAAARGDRVVTLFATGGEHGTVPPDLPAGRSLADYRRGEAEAAARVLGTEPPRWLGYLDSGMTGWEQGGHEEAFARADTDVAARKIADVLDELGADALVGYDWHGNYGHPDHIAVHRAGRRAVELAAGDVTYLEATNRNESWAGLRLLPEAQELMEQFGYAEPPSDEEWDKLQRGDDGLPVGVPESEIAWKVELSDDLIAKKRAAMACHASQTSDIGMMLSLPPAVYKFMFGTEYLVEPGRFGPPEAGWPLP